MATDERSMRSRRNVPEGGCMNRPLPSREIAEIEDQIRAYHPDLQGLCLALADWSAELRMLIVEREKLPGTDGDWK